MARYVPLATLAAEGFAASPSAMFLQALDDGLPLGLDAKGNMCLFASSADRMRQERRELQERAARESELRRQAQQDAEVAAVVARERAAQVRDRERRLEELTGLSLAQLEGAMRSEPLNRPGAVFTLADRDVVYNRDITLDDLEAFAAEWYGPDRLASA